MGAGITKPIKPISPRINGTHPIARGLQYDMLLTEGGGTTVTDGVSKTVGTITNTAWTVDRYGKALNFANTDSVVTAPPVTGNPLNGATQYSYEVMFNATGLGGGSIGYLILKGKTNFYLFVQIKVGPVINIFMNYSVLDGTWSFPTTTDGAWHHLVLTMNYGAAAGTAPIVTYDGQLQTLTPGDVPSGTPVADDGTLFIGNNAATAGTRNWQGQIAYVRGWNRILAPNEAQQLYVNPWCIYRQLNLDDSV
jgi:hypothetical protein